jgi:Ca2+-binding EF-hand superfamily protein
MIKMLAPALLLLAACGPASAQQHDGAKALAQLEKADTNRDGAVSRQEFTSFRSSQFSRIDRNGDGFITEADIPSFAKNRLPPEMSIDNLKVTFDTNKDGKISKAEFTGGPALMFDRVDADKNDIATKAEFDAARAAFASRQ